MPARRGAAVTAAGECEAVGAGINSSKRRGRRSWEGIGGPRRRWQDSRSKETEGADGGIFFFPLRSAGADDGVLVGQKEGSDGPREVPKNRSKTHTHTSLQQII